MKISFTLKATCTEDQIGGIMATVQSAWPELMGNVEALYGTNYHTPEGAKNAPPRGWQITGFEMDVAGLNPGAIGAVATHVAHLAADPEIVPGWAINYHLQG